jgi:hypothetical protein
MNEEGQGADSFGFLDPKGFESLKKAQSNLPIEVYYVRFQVLTAASMKFRVFWDVAPCSLVGVDQRFTDAYCLHHEGDDRHDDGGSKHL